MTTTTNTPVEVCDDCLDVAYDMGIEGYEEQAYMMQMIGREAPDHLCIETEEPGLMACACGCREL